MKKKQTVMFYGVNALSKMPTVSHDFEYAIKTMIDDPKPLNRKSRRAAVKMISSDLDPDKAERYEEEKAKRLQARKEKARKTKADGYLRRRANRLRK